MLISDCFLLHTKFRRIYKLLSGLIKINVNNKKYVKNIEKNTMQRCVDVHNY